MNPTNYLLNEILQALRSLEGFMDDLFSSALAAMAVFHDCYKSKRQARRKRQAKGTITA